jgi:septum formation protein
MMETMENKLQLYLASASPRRQELLEQIGVDYQVIAQDIKEDIKRGEAPEEFVIRMALEKSRAALGALGKDQRFAVIGADTAVVIDGKVLGKPKDKQDGMHMLELLSGREHYVLSAVALVTEIEKSRLSVSKVRFRKIQEKERDAYWETGEPSGKAGGYAIQGMAAVFIEHLEGSYSGVMGLPLFETAELLQESGVAIFNK